MIGDRKFIVVQSSAGSGKTYTLVKNYLLLMLSSPDIRYYRHIMAITFTNKATNEMKERLIDALDGISTKRKKYSGLTSELSEELNIPVSDIIEKSGRILRNLLHDYSEFSISTIDRFVYRIIRSFAFELNLSGNAEIEMNRDSIIEAGVDSLFDSLSDKNAITDILVEFSDHKFVNGKSINIHKDLSEMAGEILNEKFRPFMKELEKISGHRFKEIRDELKKRKKEIRDIITGKAQHFLKRLQELGIDGLRNCRWKKRS